MQKPECDAMLNHWLCRVTGTKTSPPESIKALELKSDILPLFTVRKRNKITNIDASSQKELLART